MTLAARLQAEIDRIDEEIGTLLERRCLLADAAHLVADKVAQPAVPMMRSIKPTKPKAPKRKPIKPVDPKPVDAQTTLEAPAWAVALKQGAAPAPAEQPAEAATPVTGATPGSEPPPLSLDERVRRFLEFSGPTPVKTIAESVGDTYQRVYNVLIGRNRGRYQQHPRTKEWSLKSHG